MGNDRIDDDQIFHDLHNNLEEIQNDFSSVFQDSTARSRSISRNHPRPDSLRYVSHHNRIFDLLND
jgi:hypothetical protein